MVRLYGVSARALPIAPKQLYIGRPHHPACRTRQAFLLEGTTDGAIKAPRTSKGRGSDSLVSNIAKQQRHPAGVTSSVDASAP